jgi:hypothetical protein
MRLLFALLSISLLSAASAGEIKVPLAGLGWQISFEGATLKQYALDYPNGSVQFRANSGRFNVSVFVEPPPEGAKASSHAACRDFYWPQAKRNPTIVADTIKQTSHSNCEAVAYRSKGEIQGTAFTQDSVNCFFVHEGKWVDVHASIIEPTAEDSKTLSEFPKTLTYGPFKASNEKVEKITFEGVGTLSFTPPAGWVIGNVMKDDTTVRGTIFTVSFLSPKDPNSSCLMSFSAPPKVPDSVEALRQMVESSSQQMATASVEGKANLCELKLKQGYGVVASFTDASLVGKPVIQGNSKALTSGLLVPKSNVLMIVTMFMDDANGEDAKSMIQALETVVVE